MLHPKTWLCFGVSLLVLLSAFYIALPHASAGSVALQHRLVPAQRSISANGLCPYSEKHTVVIIDSNKWTRTVYVCGTGLLAHKIDHANDIYDNGGGPMWVKWSEGSHEHFCSISGLGAYWEFSKPVTIVQIYYGDNHADSYCP